MIKYYLATALAVFVFFVYSNASGVDVPDFSFKGEEVASFAITPTFKDIELQIGVPSEFSNYLENQSIELAKEQETAYSTETPSFWYSFRPTTYIASIFTGDRAYRNYLVRKFLNEDYIGYNDNYKRYVNNVATTEYTEETELLHAVSLLKLGDKEGEQILRNICITGEYFREAACDKYVEILWLRKGYSGVIDAVDKMRRPLTPYTFSAYALSTFYRGEYAKASAILQNNPDILFKFPDFNDLRAVVEYYNSNYAAVTKLAPYTTDNISFISADSLINIEKFLEARPYISKVNSEADRNYLDAKILIGQKKFSEFINTLKSIPDENKRFDLMNYYVAREFPKINPDILSVFKFSGPEKRYYADYYMGLQELNLKNYTKAAAHFEKVKTPPDLAAEARFYRGIALVYVDPAAAEADIVNTMNQSRDPEQIAASRFMLAQVYYMKGDYDDAMQLVDGCTEIYCKQLTAELNLKKSRYDKALTDLEGINTTQAYFIRASVYYNLMQYDKARQELDNIRSNSKENQHLRMMLYFKEDNLKAATDILTANRTYPPILYDGVKELMLAGDYKLAIKLLSEETYLPPDMHIVNAKLLAWVGKENEARYTYNQLLKSRVMIYDSLYGLISLEKTPQNEMVQISSILKEMPALGEFPQKDLLLTQMAAKAARAKENVVLIQIINNFFPEYENSEYAGDMYIERAKLFYTTGRSKECLQDITTAVQRNPIFADELKFIKAQCMEDTNLEGALTEYSEMFEDDDRYRLPAAVKLMDMSSSPALVLNVASQIKAESPQLYIEGIRRYAEIATAEDLTANEIFITSLTKESNIPLKSAGSFALARLTNERGKGRDAARLYYQIYQMDQTDHFAIPSLEAAAEIYTQLSMKTEAAQMQELLKKQKSKK